MGNGHYASSALKISIHFHLMILLPGLHTEEITPNTLHNSCTQILTAASCVRAEHLNTWQQGVHETKYYPHQVMSCSLQILIFQVILNDTDKCSRDNAAEENGRQHCLDTRIQFWKITRCNGKRLERDIPVVFSDPLRSRRSFLVCSSIFQWACFITSIRHKFSDNYKNWDPGRTHSLLETGRC